MGAVWLLSLSSVACLNRDTCIRIITESETSACVVFINSEGIDENGIAQAPVVYEGTTQTVFGCICVNEQEQAILEEADELNPHYQTLIGQIHNRAEAACLEETVGWQSQNCTSVEPAGTVIFTEEDDIECPRCEFVGDPLLGPACPPDSECNPNQASGGAVEDGGLGDDGASSSESGGGQTDFADLDLGALISFTRGAYVIDQLVLDTAASDFMGFQLEDSVASVEQVYDATGNEAGLEIGSAPAGSLAALLGFQAGDVVVEVFGTTCDDLEDLWAINNAIVSAGATSFDVKVERGTSTVTLSYRID